MIIGIADPSYRKLAEITQTDCTLASFSRGTRHRQEDRQQDGNDSDHHKQLNERETVAIDER